MGRGVSRRRNHFGAGPWGGATLIEMFSKKKDREKSKLWLRRQREGDFEKYHDRKRIDTRSGGFL